MIFKLGHFPSCTVRKELNNENAYKMIRKQQQNEVILPSGVLEEVFTLVVTDNIVRKEEGLSDKNSLLNKSGCKLLLIKLLNYFVIILC